MHTNHLFTQFVAGEGNGSFGGHRIAPPIKENFDRLDSDMYTKIEKKDCNVHKI